MTAIQQRWSTCQITERILRNSTLDVCNEHFADTNVTFTETTARRVEFKMGTTTYCLYRWNDEPSIINSSLPESCTDLSDDELLATIRSNRISDKLLVDITEFCKNNIFSPTDELI